MASFRDILLAADADLVKLLYKLQPDREADFIKHINRAAAQLGVNHTQLVCALGFNRHVPDLTDVLSLVGFSSYRSLSLRRNELFTTDVYRQLDIDNVLDIYATSAGDEPALAMLRELALARLINLERGLEAGGDAALPVAYKMELHAIYTGGIATTAFAQQRVASPNGDKRVLSDEIQMIVGGGLIPPSNLFFDDDVLPAEKRVLIDGGHITPAMIANRLQNSEISEDERQLLEGLA